MDLNAIPSVKEVTNLPVIVDPSHGTGRSSIVESMSLAAVAAGADGLLIEVHPNPQEALSDGDQQITPDVFYRLAKKILKINQLMRDFSDL